MGQARTLMDFYLQVVLSMVHGLFVGVTRDLLGRAALYITNIQKQILPQAFSCLVGRSSVLGWHATSTA